MDVVLHAPGRGSPGRALGAEPLGHIPALDGLRALAVLAVLAYHGGARWLGGGFLGVSAFFTLSGFLITSLLVREWHGSGGVDLRRFWRRRFRRLLPASWATIALVLAMGALGAWGVEQLRSLRADVPWALAELVNWHFIDVGSGYGSTVAPPSPLQHFWSLAVEQQFYVVLPLVVVGALGVASRGGGASGRRRLAVLAGALAVLAAASAGANWALARESVERAYFGTDTRAAEMLLGALLAVATTTRLRFRSPSGRAAGSVAGLAGLVALAWLVHAAAVGDAWLYPWGLLLTAGCTVAVILGAIQGGLLGAALSVGPLVALGRISYGVYLVHWPVFLWLNPTRTGWDGPALFAVRLAVSVSVAAASYTLMERPIRSGRRLRPSTALRVVPAAVVVLLVADLVATRGLPGVPDYLRVSDEAAVEVHEAPAPAPAPASAPALAAAAPAPEPTVAPATSAPVRASRVLLVGDSVAASLEDALGDTLAAFGVTYGTAAAPGCGVVTGLPTDEQGRVAAMTRPCDAAIPRRQLEAVATVRPDLVVVMSSWEMTNREVDGTWYPFGTAKADEVLRRLLSEAVDRLSAGGATVAFVLMPDMVDGRDHAVDPVEVERGRHLNLLLGDVARAHPGRVTTLPLDRVVCPADPCPTVVGGLELRARDGRHFDDPAAARWVSQRLTEKMLAVDLANP